MKTSKIITDLATGLLFALLGMGACVSDSGLTDGTGGKKGSGGSYGSGGQTTAHRGSGDSTQVKGGGGSGGSREEPGQRPSWREAGERPGAVRETEPAKTLVIARNLLVLTSICKSMTGSLQVCYRTTDTDALSLFDRSSLMCSAGETQDSSSAMRAKSFGVVAQYARFFSVPSTPPSNSAPKKDLESCGA